LSLDRIYKLYYDVKVLNKRNEGTALMQTKLSRQQRRAQARQLAKGTQSGHTLQSVSQELHASALKNGFKEGVDTGLQRGTLFITSVFEKTLDETKGIGQKKAEELRKTFMFYFNNQDYFREVMGKTEEPLDNFHLIAKEDAPEIKRLLGEINNVPENSQFHLTLVELLSILNTEQGRQLVRQHEDLHNI
jgi:ERCC4-type nuclease